ncbi:dNTP triphosphohydrolase [candidate division KSB1 bacterium]|nr:dNTP triphosphohydrolase [candidate division KSB1 bacterium]
MTFSIRTRSDWESAEDQLLTPFAAHSKDFAGTRLHEEPEHAYRTAFQRDRDRIIHSRAFRRLKHKRQVFLTHSGDHYRTRLTHTLEVAQLSRTMARSLGLNEDLVEAIALGHDLGHTPFGHIGEIVLHDIMCGSETLSGVLPGRNQGGFKHNYQSVRVVDLIEKKYTWPGLNLTACVREGILKHTRLRRNELHFADLNLQGLHYELDHATTLEGQIVAVCDEIAQRTHDLEDGIRAGYVSLRQVLELPLIQEADRCLAIKPTDELVHRNYLIRALINLLVTDVMEASLHRVQHHIEKTGRQQYFDRQIMWFSDAIHPLQEALDGFIAENIIKIASEERSDERAVYIIHNLFKAFYQNPHLLPTYVLANFVDDATMKAIMFAPAQHDEGNEARTRVQNHTRFLRAICDHIAGMTDNYANSEIVRVEQELYGG